MAMDIGGDGLFHVDRALDRFEADPSLLDHARMRFSMPPPLYSSDRSGTATRSESAESEEPVEYEATHPRTQFSIQNNDEVLYLMGNYKGLTCRIPLGANPNKMAHSNVKRRWKEQGIWKDTWGTFPVGGWKHEAPLELEAETDLSEDGRRHLAERRAVLEREREASQPYHQFLYQVSHQRERLMDEEGAAPADLNSRAYEKVKATWIRHKLWSTDWEILPGMSWKHEESSESNAGADAAAVAATEPEADKGKLVPRIRTRKSPKSRLADASAFNTRPRLRRGKYTSYDICVESGVGAVTRPRRNAIVVVRRSARLRGYQTVTR